MGRMSLMSLSPTLCFVIASISLLIPYHVPTKAERVTFEIVPFKRTYDQNEPITLRLILTNRGETPVTVERFSVCGDDFFAFAEVKIQDAHGRGARHGGCAGDHVLTKEEIARFESEVGRSDHWITLNPGDLYGEETVSEVRTKKGVYTIKAYFLPARFHEKERKRIADRGITVLSGQIDAVSVQIRVR
jgi:hypothetical protein